ncbi:hypothetical protein DUNSADRAFT_9952 [Dunaliella salina]|uniref:RAP domain-containing protein n=1 Tax=Dunaliella salina TaxID=3046 RepID=A0ABQ7GGE7_DUNSA|nr:hypothetical protein DUNSADRAFT_9952 [Dunaliella salina]|eukprot:KAF5833680.1 hypothetical protein DUNSADRAFT_9952 [Dunaliella salina]
MPPGSVVLSVLAHSSLYAAPQAAFIVAFVTPTSDLSPWLPLPPLLLDASGERVLSVLAHSSLRAAPHMSMQGLAMAARALAQLSFTSPPLYAGLAAAMLSKAQQLPLLQPPPLQPLSRQGLPQLQQQLHLQTQQQQQQQLHLQQQHQQQQYPGLPVPNAHRRHDHGIAVAALSTMALVLACMGVPSPPIMDAAMAAALAAAACSLPSVGVGAAALTPTMPPPATPTPQALSITGRAPDAAHKPSSLRASPGQAAAPDAAPMPNSSARSLQQGAKIRRGGGAASAVQLVQLLFALGRAKHPCDPRKLDVLVGMLAREWKLLGTPMQQPSGQAGRSLVSPQQDVPGLFQSEQQAAQHVLQQQQQEQQQEQARGLGHHSPGLLAMFLMACVSLRYQPPHQLLLAVCCALEGNIARLSTQTVCELLCSLAALQHDPGAVLLDELVGVVEGRVMQQRQELLTLESLVKLAWGLACLKQYKRPLFKRAVRRALGSSAGALSERPQLLRQLLELKMLFQVERRAGGYWHMLRPCWERRVAAGGADRVSEAVLLQGAGLPPAGLASAVKATEIVKAQVLVMLHALGVDDPKWQTLQQGDQACIFHYAPSRRRGRSNSWGQQLQQRRQAGSGGGQLHQCSQAGSEWEQLQQRRQTGSGLAKAGSAEGDSEASSARSVERAASSNLEGFHGRVGGLEEGVGHPGSGNAGAVKEWGCSNVAFEGRRPTRSKKLAVTLLAPWHLSVNAGGVPLVSAAIRDRILARKQCSVLAVRVEEWLALSTEARRQILLGFLFG